MFENIMKFFKKFGKNEKESSKVAAKERLHLVLAQDRANISADFLEMMKQEIIDVIKKYVDIDEEAIDVRMTNKPGEDGIIGAPALYANIPIVTIKNDTRKLEGTIEKVKEAEKNSHAENKKKNKKINASEEDKKEETSEIKEENQAELEEKEDKIETEKQEKNNAEEGKEIEDKKEE